MQAELRVVAGGVHRAPGEGAIAGAGADHRHHRLEREHRLGRDDAVLGDVLRGGRVELDGEEHGVHRTAAAGDPVCLGVLDHARDDADLHLALVEGAGWRADGVSQSFDAHVSLLVRPTWVPMNFDTDGTANRYAVALHPHHAG